MNYINKKMVLMVATMVATAIGSFGGFPEPPQIFLQMSQYEPFKWLMMFVLILQGGGGFDVKLSLVGTALIYAVYTGVRYMEKGVKQVEKVF